MEFDKAQLVNLRNLSLALHASAGRLITVPTDGAIVGSADQDDIKIAMNAYLSLILLDIVHIQQSLGLTAAEIQQAFDQARTA